jgi:hypothetical protein
MKANEATNAQIDDLIAEVVPRGIVVSDMAVQQLRPLLDEVLELRAKLAGMDSKIRDVMHTLSVIMEGRAINPDLSAGACYSVLSKLLPAAPYGEEKP